MDRLAAFHTSVSSRIPGLRDSKIILPIIEAVSPRFPRIRGEVPSQALEARVPFAPYGDGAMGFRHPEALPFGCAFPDSGERLVTPIC